MLSWRAKRQAVVVGIVLLGAGIALASLLSRVLPTPSCTDRRQNQGEVGVDCGGPCAPCELQNPAEVEVLWTRAVPVEVTTYAVATQIQNPNELLSSPRLVYEFTLFDDVGQVARRAGTTFLLPQERAHVIETNLMTTRSPTRVEFQILDTQWQFQRLSRPNLVVERRDYREEEGEGKRRSVVETVLLNRSPVGFRAIEVGYLVLDPDGNLLGANRVLAENLSAGSRTLVKSIWPRVLRGEPATLEVEPRVNVLDPFVILSP